MEFLGLVQGVQVDDRVVIEEGEGLSWVGPTHLKAHPLVAGTLTGPRTALDEVLYSRVGKAEELCTSRLWCHNLDAPTNEYE